MGMAAVSAQEHSMVYGISLRYALANRVDRIPIYRVPFDVVRL